MFTVSPMWPGIWDPVFDEQHLWPLSLRSQESATRARLSSCDWATHKHYCRSPRDAAAAVCGIHMRRATDCGTTPRVSAARSCTAPTRPPSPTWPRGAASATPCPPTPPCSQSGQIYLVWIKIFKILLNNFLKILNSTFLNDFLIVNS